MNPTREVDSVSESPSSLVPDSEDVESSFPNPDASVRTSMKDRYAICLRQNLDLKNTIASLESEIKGLNEQIRELKRALNLTEGGADYILGKVLAVESEQAASKASIDGLKAKLSVARKENAQLRWKVSRLEGFKAQLLTSREKIQRLSSDLGREGKRANRARNDPPVPLDADQIMAKMREMAKMMDERAREMATMRQEIDVAKQEREEFRTKLNHVWNYLKGTHDLRLVNELCTAIRRHGIAENQDEVPLELEDDNGPEKSIKRFIRCLKHNGDLRPELGLENTDLDWYQRVMFAIRQKRNAYSHPHEGLILDDSGPHFCPTDLEYFGQCSKSITLAVGDI